MASNGISYVYKSTLKKEPYYLTDRLIKRLGEPDKYVKNPYYSSGPQSALYEVKRVEKFISENLSEVEKIGAKRPLRKEAAKKAVDTKIEKITNRANNIELVFKELPSFSDIFGIAREHASERYGGEARTPGFNGIMATVRHEFTNYHAILAEFVGKVGCGLAYEELRARLDIEVERRVLEAYPNIKKD